MKSTRLLSCFLFVLGFLASSVFAGPNGRVELPIQSGGAFSVPVASLKEIRFRTTLRQQHDFSCGSAALATLLTYHYAYPVNEQTIFRVMYERGDKAKIRKEGFSLLDMKSYLEAQGFQADGFVAELEQLSTANIPGIVLIKEQGYNHFVVVKGLRNGRVLVGDPSSGTRILPVDRFKSLWINHILFVIRNKTDVAMFNANADWRVAPMASTGDAIYHGAAEPMLPKFGTADF